ncbi:glycerophosphodiester phosphodiesterase [Oceanobacillus neutriphilus]|uniref:GP-PDE domain-containing protein n=1 Tax=Oceanobacillus neutriphilus TaxID=531815 RepID=A0ABQ2NWC2_9BACI|nr:glycerophosphodiester phosphodiesterase family protein [Oceanobacillus neutriphilus]GGP12235.1 hypothetical protein GCM10011346_27460 [Oceanobacillus neutriphilus]
MPWRRILLSFAIAIFIISGFFEAEAATSPQTNSLYGYGTETLYAKAAENPEAVSADIEIIANRGANNVFNEHTLSAYKFASDANADSLEIDLRMTKDNELIALHDATLDRTTTGSGVPEELTLREMKQLDTVAESGQEIAPEIRTTLLYGRDKFDLKDALEANVDVIGIESSNVTRDIVEELHQQGKEVHVFFMDERTELVEQQRVMMYGVDGVFTDDIGFTKQVIMQ